MVLVLNQPQFSIHLFSLTIPLQFYQVIHPNALNLQSLGHWSAFWRQGTMRRWYQIMWLLFPTRDKFQIICVFVSQLVAQISFYHASYFSSHYCTFHSFILSIPPPIFFSLFSNSYLSPSLLLYLIFLPFSLNFALSPSLPISHNLVLFQDW